MSWVQRISFSILILLLVSSNPTIGQSQHRNDIPTLDRKIAAVELDAAAELYVRIERIHARFDSRLLAVSRQGKKSNLNAKREQAIESALYDSCLLENRYHTILDLADTDDALRQRLASHISAERRAN